jgi:hypothetical protein
VKDRVTAEVRELVLRRDAMCFLYRVDDKHYCHDAFGNPHSPFDRDRLTLDHVKDQPRMGKRAPSDPAHLVAMCHASNVAVPSKTVRELERQYLREVS